MRFASRPTPNAPKGDIKNLRHLWTYLRPYRLHMVGAVIALLFTSGGVLGMGQALKYLVDEGLSKGNPELLDKSYAIALGVTFLLAFATYSRFYLVTWIGERVTADIRSAIYKHLISMHVGFFEIMRTGDILSRLTTDTTLLQTVIGSSVSIALRNLLMMIGGVTLLLITSLKLTANVFMMLPLVVIPIIFLGRKVRVLSRDTQDRVGELNSLAEESISGIRTIQSLALESYEQTRFQHKISETLATARARIRLRAMLTGIVIALVFGAVMTVLFFGGRDVLEGKISAGQLSSFVFYAVLVAGSIGALSEVVGDLQRAAGAAERLMELLSFTPAITAPQHPRTLEEPIRGAIYFDHVTFRYPSRADKSALDNVTLSIAPGETVALVGPSGAGKTTMMQLLLRFYDPAKGSITIDDMDLREMDPSYFRKLLAIVPQDPLIFSTNVWENIRVGNPEASEEDIRTAARAAAALEFVEKLPQGFDSYLGEKGVRLSGGQKQRIAIARALVRNPKILLLDEATSALDSENEQLVQHALDGLMAARTTLIIAHRLSTVQNADRIIVMDEGRIVATGTHRELLSSSPLYARLASLQFGNAA